jgi:hypothetical protein
VALVTSLDEVFTVGFVSLWPAEPVFHAFRRAERVERGNPPQAKWIDVSECGRELDYLIPTEHARKFGRPCRRCFS